MPAHRSRGVAPTGYGGMRRLAAAIAMVGLSVGVVVVVWSEPAAAAGPRIVVATGTPASLQVVREDGTLSTIATPSGGSSGYSAPRWSPDGTRIAAVVNKGDAQCVAVMNGDGSSLRELECGETTGVAWSGNGEQLVVEALGQLAVMNVDGSSRRSIPNTAAGAAQPDWSPDGTAIVYVARGATTYGFPAHWDPKLRIPRGQVVAAASIVSPKY